MSSLASSYTTHNVRQFIGHSPYPDYLVLSTHARVFNESSLTRINEYTWDVTGDWTPVSLYHSKKYNTVTLKGSLAWFSNGHNLSFSPGQLQTTIDNLSTRIDLDFNNAGIKQMEVSKLINVPYPVEEYQNNLLDLPGFERVHRGTLYYNRKGRKAKMTLKYYNATKNAISKRMSVIPEGNWMKYEMKFNPSAYFKQAITICDLITNREIINKSYMEMKVHHENTKKGVVGLLPPNPSQQDILIVDFIKNNSDPYEAIENYLKYSGKGRKAKSDMKGKLIKKIEMLSRPNDKYQLRF